MGFSYDDWTGNAYADEVAKERALAASPPEELVERRLAVPRALRIVQDVIAHIEEAVMSTPHAQEKHRTRKRFAVTLLHSRRPKRKSAPAATRVAAQVDVAPPGLHHVVPMLGPVPQRVTESVRTTGVPGGPSALSADGLPAALVDGYNSFILRARHLPRTSSALQGCMSWCDRPLAGRAAGADVR